VALDKITRRSLIDQKKERALARRQVEDLAIRVSGLNLPVSSLSGGNQQIFQIIWEQSRKGISSIMVSSELDDLYLLCMGAQQK